MITKLRDNKKEFRCHVNKTHLLWDTHFLELDCQELGLYSWMICTRSWNRQLHVIQVPLITLLLLLLYPTQYSSLTLSCYCNNSHKNVLKLLKHSLDKSQFGFWMVESWSWCLQTPVFRSAAWSRAVCIWYWYVWSLPGNSDT